LSISLQNSSKLKKTLGLNVNEIIEAPIVRLHQVDSTNNHAARMIDADKAQAGLTILAEEQAAGKGQRGNVWKDEPGQSLLMSIIIYPNVATDGQFSFNAAVAVAVAQVLQKLVPQIDVKIKWPNDIIVNDKKAAGILIENTFRGSNWSHSIIGLGLNVLQSYFPPELPNAHSLFLATHKLFSIEELMQLLREQIIRNTYNNNLQPFLTEYNRLLYKLGKQQKFMNQEQEFSAEIMGVNNNGQLVLKHADGRTEAYTHGILTWIW
jgi:BirA family biotin operon repressor/biotin-[acetyl-CoA-carboxylase] ligase